MPVRCPLSRCWPRLRRHPALVFGLALLGTIVALAWLGPLFYAGDAWTQDLTQRTTPPVWHARGTWQHPLGTDALGRDYLARLLYGARVSLAISAAVVLICGCIGTALGVLAGYLGGRVDWAISFLITAFLALPGILLALVIVAMLGGSLAVVIAVLALFMWLHFAVVVRGSTRQISAMLYVRAAQALGASRWHIIRRQILPNVLPQVIVVATLEAASAIMAEAALSFLGLGVQPPTPSWGLMIAEARNYMFFSFWLIAIPGSALAILVLAVNLTGDGLRDWLASSGAGQAR